MPAVAIAGATLTLTTIVSLLLALRFRRLTPVGVALAVVPALALVGWNIAISAQSGDKLAHIDLIYNYQGSVALYLNGMTPYTTHGAISFPFPTFYVFYAASGFGAWSLSMTWLVITVVSVVLWLLCSVAYYLTSSPDVRRAVLLMCVGMPVSAVLSNGQTSVLTLAGLTALCIGITRTDRRWWWIAGAGLATAVLFKPQLAILGIGAALWWFWSRRDTAKVITVGAACALTAAMLVVMTLILPGGVTFDYYIQFVRDVLPSLGHDINLPYSLSIPFAVRVWTDSAIAGTLTSLVILLAAVCWTWQRRDRALVEVAAGWIVFAMTITNIAWGYYTVWAMPYFVLAMREAAEQRRTVRMALLIAAAALAGWQTPSLLFNAGEMTLLLALAWTSLRTEAVTVRVTSSVLESVRG